MMEINRFIKIMSVLMFVLSVCKKLTSVSAAEVRCIEKERQALLKFKHDLVDGYSALSSWGSEDVKKECCKWEGVSCSNKTGHVVSLDLSEFQWVIGFSFLKAKFSPALLELQHLTYLDMSYNDFGGSEIPRFFGSFEKLRHLKLSASNFTGEVPCELGNLTNLHTLDLRYNHLRIKNLGCLSHLSSLSYLDLNGVNLINQTSWLHHMTRFPFLKELYLSSCQLPNPGPSFDIFTNSSLPYLSILDLSINDLTSSFALRRLFNSSASLTILDLSYNQLDGPIPDDFGELIFLERLSLSNNTFHGGIPKSLGNLSHLYSLEISNNELNGPLPDNNSKFQEFHPQSLGLPSSLVHLDLSYNQFKRLPEGIEKLSELKYLGMSSNLLEDTIAESYLSNFANLKFLDVSFNSLAFNLSSDWIPHFQLATLRLSHCYLGPRFPNWIQTQNTLRELDISFAGILDELPNWLWNMSSLDHIDLSHNNISGKIPELSAKLDHRGTIDLSYNNFSGPIPLFLFHSVELKLSKNMFSGSIFHLCTIPKGFVILVLDLSDNQLDGELPNCWMNMSYLVVLDLSNNQFSGKIPLSLGTLNQIMILHLRENNFIGELPSTLKNCIWLRTLDVGGNMLTGNIPAWIGTHLTRLTLLSLRFNEFDGIMPSTICRLTNTHVLDLSRNKISGRISRCLNNFTAWVQKNSSIEKNGFFGYNHRLAELYVNKAFVRWKGQDIEYRKVGLLKDIDLSSNKLVGTIPQEFSALKGSVFLNLSRNHLTGNIISYIGQMEMLESLDLSRNQLSGEIPSSIVRLNFLSVLDLSFNNLTGKIPLGTQLQSFNSSVYIGNSQLCGKPLTECSGDIFNSSMTDQGNRDIFEEEDDGFITHDFYIYMAFGFIIGFSIVVTTLILKHSWRHSYFNWWNNVGNWINVTTTIYMEPLSGDKKVLTIIHTSCWLKRCKDYGWHCFCSS